MQVCIVRLSIARVYMRFTHNHNIYKHSYRCDTNDQAQKSDVSR